MRIRSVGNIGEHIVQLRYDMCGGLGRIGKMAAEGGAIDNPVKEELLSSYEGTTCRVVHEEGAFTRMQWSITYDRAGRL